jgi:hypothetical protein
VNLLPHGHSFDVGILWRQVLGLENKSVLLVFLDGSLSIPDIATPTAMMEACPDEHDELADEHTNGACQQPANDAKERRDNEESKCLVEHVAETVAPVMRTMVAVIRATLVIAL